MTEAERVGAVHVLTVADTDQAFARTYSDWRELADRAEAVYAIWEKVNKEATAAEVRAAEAHRLMNHIRRQAGQPEK